MKVKKTTMEESIDKGIKFLLENQKEDGSVYLEDDKRWQVWETANSYLAVHLAGKNNKKFLDKSINFLLEVQRDDGSYSHDVNFKKNHY